MDKERMFPIQPTLTRDRRSYFPASAVPWWLAELAYAGYVARYGDRQSLERLAERGGFSRGEFLEFLHIALKAIKETDSK